MSQFFQHLQMDLSALCKREPRWAYVFYNGSLPQPDLRSNMRMHAENENETQAVQSANLAMRVRSSTQHRFDRLRNHPLHLVVVKCFLWVVQSRNERMTENRRKQRAGPYIVAVLHLQCQKIPIAGALNCVQLHPCCALKLMAVAAAGGGGGGGV